MEVQLSTPKPEGEKPKPTKPRAPRKRPQPARPASPTIAALKRHIQANQDAKAVEMGAPCTIPSSQSAPSLVDAISVAQPPSPVCEVDAELVAALDGLLNAELSAPTMDANVVSDNLLAAAAAAVPPTVTFQPPSPNDYTLILTELFNQHIASTLAPLPSVLGSMRSDFYRHLVISLVSKTITPASTPEDVINSFFLALRYLGLVTI